MNLRAQDILVTLKLAVAPHRPSYADLGGSVGLSASQAHSSVKRASASGLLVGQPARVNTQALLEFLVHGLRYVLPAVRGSLKRGIPTAHSASPLRELLVAGDVAVVWADPNGDTRGETIEPIYKTAPAAALGDPQLYELLILIDAIRGGRARERELATSLLKERLQRVETDRSEPRDSDSGGTAPGSLSQ